MKQPTVLFLVLILTFTALGLTAGKCYCAQTVYSDSIKPYVEFLNKQKTSPVDYIMSLFENYEIVILCERYHTEVTQYEMLFDLIKDERFQNSVGNIFTEVGSVSIRDKMSKYLTDDSLNDEQIEKGALDIYRNLTWFPVWEKTNFFEFIKKTHRLNSGLAGGKKIMIYPCDMFVDWNTTTPQKYKEFSSKLDERDKFMADNVISTVKNFQKNGSKRKKALVIMNYRHAFNDKFKFLMGDPPDNTGRYIFEAFPGKVANVMINSLKLLPGTTDQKVIDTPLQDGKWDAAFKAAGVKSVGFNFEGSPFGLDFFDYFAFVPHFCYYRHVFTGYIFHLPLEEHVQMTGIPKMLDDGYESIILERSVNTGEQTTSEAALYLSAFKKDGVKTFGYEKMEEHKKKIDQWLK